LLIAAALALLHFGREVFEPFALAVLLSFLLTPVVRRTEKVIGRAFAVVAVMAIVLAALASVGWTVANQLADMASDLPAYRSNIRKKLESLRGPEAGALGKAAESVQEIRKELSGEAGPANEAARPADGKDSQQRPRQQQPSKKGGGAGPAGSAGEQPILVQIGKPTGPMEYLREVGGPLVGPVGTVLLALVFSVFMLLKREDLRNRFIGLVGGDLTVTTSALDDATRRVTRYLSLQLAVNTTFGALFGTGLYFIGLPNALLWGVLGALLRFIPYVGTLMAAVIPTGLAFAISSDWKTPLLTFGLFVAIEAPLSNFVEPWLYGTHTGLSSLAVLFAALVWTTLWGPVGLIISTPLTVCLAVVGRYVPELSFLGILLGDEPALTPEAHFYQRLLSLDYSEARAVAFNYVKEHTVIELYDTVLIPALALAERDRHQGALDSVKQNFVLESMSELVGDLADYRPETADEQSNEAQRQPLRVPEAEGPAIICVPARDDADELVASMLAQTLSQNGYRAVVFPVAGNPIDSVENIAHDQKSLLCVSALPPFALIPALRLCKDLRDRFPSIKIILGLWTSHDAAEKAGRRMDKLVDKAVSSLAQALEHINAPSGEASEPVTPDQSRPAA
jgi:predicted PurR-regulated permease PerM